MQQFNRALLERLLLGFDGMGNCDARTRGLILTPADDQRLREPDGPPEVKTMRCFTS